jgi:hypothetical protein
LADSAHEAILDAFEAILVGMGLQQAAGEPLKVYRRTSLADVGLGGNIDFPSCVYGPDGTLTSLDADTAEEVWSYPVSVRLLARLPLTEPEFTPLLLKWRRQVRDAFHRKPLVVAYPGLQEVPQALLGPSPVSEPEAAAYQLLSSRLSFAITAVEARP